MQSACNKNEAGKFSPKIGILDDSWDKIGNMQRRSIPRTKRLLNDAVRTKGLDLDSLAMQTRDHANQESRRRSTAEHEKTQIAKEIQQSSQYDVDCRLFVHASKETYARELQAQIDSKIEISRKNKERDATTKSVFGPASLQVFAGQDIGGEIRRRDEALKHVKYLEKQISDRGSILPEIPLVPRSTTARDQILNRGSIQRQYNSINSKMAAEKTVSAIDEKTYLATLPVAQPHTRQTDFKGFTSEETRACLIPKNSEMIQIHKDQIMRMKREGIEQAHYLNRESEIAKEMAKECILENRKLCAHNLKVSELNAEINRVEKDTQAKQSEIIEYVVRCFCIFKFLANTTTMPFSVKDSETASCRKLLLSIF